tara:strand:+ start:139 stop:507 length:369 start_codon:yes stop_codon:yes gene_type:complete
VNVALKYTASNNATHNNTDDLDGQHIQLVDIGCKDLCVQSVCIFIPIGRGSKENTKNSNINTNDVNVVFRGDGKESTEMMTTTTMMITTTMMMIEHALGYSKEKHSRKRQDLEPQPSHEKEL